MGQEVRVSATLAGRHSLGPDGVKEACGAVERVLREGTAEYAVRSFAPGCDFARRGIRAGSGFVTVKVDESSFVAVWADESSFDVPAAALDAVGRHLGAGGDLHIRVAALVANVAMDPPKIAGGSAAATLDTATFNLSQPAASSQGMGGEGMAFSCVATAAKDSAVDLAIFGERKSAASAVREILTRSLDSLSAHCEVLAR